MIMVVLQEMKPVGPELDLLLKDARWSMLRSLVQVYRLLTAMSRDMAELPDDAARDCGGRR